MLRDGDLELIERTLNEILPSAEARPAALSEAMRWAVMGGGKRIRPRICLAAAVAVGGRAEDAIFPACAVELLHSYTLVHDDLPAMDNDVERRGRPSVWAKFGEANAILAGDALQALAFATAARAPRNVPAVVSELGRRGVGVVAGQVEDLLLHPTLSPSHPSHPLTLSPVSPSHPSHPLTLSPVSPSQLSFVYEHKTADLFMAAACMGALAGGGTPEQVEQLRIFAHDLGLAFQHEDDLLDGDSPLPREETERRIRDLTASAVAVLADLPGDVSFLVDLARRLVGRTF